MAAWSGVSARDSLAGMRIAFLAPAGMAAGGPASFYAGLLPALNAMGHAAELRHRLSDVTPDALPVLDGMLLPDLEQQTEALAAADAIVLVHHASAKAGRDPDARQEVKQIERHMLPRFRRVVATSAGVAERLAAEFGVAAPAVFRPGLPDLPRSPGSGSGCNLACIGVITPRKGHDKLLGALARLTDLDWTLAIAGDAGRDPVHAATIANLIDALGLQSRVTVLPDPSAEALEAVWRGADLFTLASRWEGYPASAAEALRRGVPAVALTNDALAALLTPSCGILCDSADPATFSKSLRRAIADNGLRAALAEGAWQAGLALPGWPRQALAFDAILRS